MQGFLIWVGFTVGLDFPGSYFPGVILMAVVGGSSMIAAAGLVKHSDGWQLASILAGTIMVFWIIGEVAPARDRSATSSNDRGNPASPRPTAGERRDGNADDTD